MWTESIENARNRPKDLIRRKVFYDVTNQSHWLFGWNHCDDWWKLSICRKKRACVEQVKVGVCGSQRLLSRNILSSMIFYSSATDLIHCRNKTPEYFCAATLSKIQLSFEQSQNKKCLKSAPSCPFHKYISPLLAFLQNYQLRDALFGTFSLYFITVAIIVVEDVLMTSWCGFFLHFTARDFTTIPVFSFLSHFVQFFDIAPNVEWRNNSVHHYCIIAEDLLNKVEKRREFLRNTIMMT